MCAYFDEIKWEEVFSGNDVEDNWNVLKEVIFKAQKCFFHSVNRKTIIDRTNSLVVQQSHKCG